MVDNNKLSKDVEEQIQNLASDVYIQVEAKLTQLITTAIKTEVSHKSAQQSKNVSEQLQLQEKEIEQLKHTLAEKELDEETAKQNFQVEITQKTINYNETIELLEKQLNNLQLKSSNNKNEKQNSEQKLEDKLLETEQSLNDKIHEVDGLNGRIMVLTEQEQSLTKALATANENIQLSQKQQSEVQTAAKVQAAAETSAKQEVDVLTEKLKQSEVENARVQAEAQQGNASKTTELEQKISQLAEQIKQEENGKAELQQQLSAQQKALDTEQDKTKQTEQRVQDYQEKVIKLTEQSTVEKQQLIEQIKSMNEGVEQVKQQHIEEAKVINEANAEAKILQTSAQQAIIELEKTKAQLNKKIETEQRDVELYLQQISTLNEQVKVAQEGQENILQRFNSNRDKQEIENNKVRETIKFLRDENHQLISDGTEKQAEFSEQLNQLEHKLTEYRLKFEYAQKQLAN